jgi:hypothetical protein
MGLLANDIRTHDKPTTVERFVGSKGCAGIAQCRLWWTSSLPRRW